MLSKLHARLGDFWWYSLMLFCACRAADALNAFVSAVAPVYANALQALKKFKAQSLLSIAGAPVRLPTMLVAVTGYGYFSGSLPVSWMAFLDAHNIRSLDSMLCWTTAVNAIKAAGCFVVMTAEPGRNATTEPTP